LLEITSQTQWEEINNSPTPIFVIFYAKWCDPCNIMIPIIKQLEKEYSNFKFIEVDIDRNKEISEKFHIDSIPSLIIFKNKKIIFQITGITSKEYCRSIIEDSKY